MNYFLKRNLVIYIPLRSFPSFFKLLDGALIMHLNLSFKLFPFSNFGMEVFVTHLSVFLKRNRAKRALWLTFPDLFGLDDIVGRYDDLSKSVNERNEKLQITLTRSLSVQDGLDEMLDWMGSVESSLKEQGQVPLNSAALQDVISKSIVSDF